jgi:hypothetical protein
MESEAKSPWPESGAMKLNVPRFLSRGSAVPLAIGVVPAHDTPPKTEACRVVLDHWLALRADRLRPRHPEFDPADVARYLPHVALFEVRSPEVTLCRLAGTAYRLTLGFELTGRNVLHLYAPELHRAAGYRFTTIVTRPCAATVDLVLRFSNQAQSPHELLFLPLEPDGPDIPPTILVVAAGIDAALWQNAAILPQLEASPTFRFIDIGAGIPASTFPPDDFAR